MKENTLIKILFVVIGLCALLTAIHIIYAVYAYQHCSIIEFIARELW